MNHGRSLAVDPRSLAVNQSNHERSLEGLWDLDLESGGAYLLSIVDGPSVGGPLESGATISIMGERTVG